MGDTYRLTELGFRLPAGTHVLAPQTAASLGPATQLLAAAEARAAEMAAEAGRAYERRCAEGYAEGMRRAACDALLRLLEENAQLDAGLRSCEAELTRLVAACTRKLVSTFDDQALAESAVRDALRQMRREKRAELRVAPEQYEAFSTAAERLAGEMPEMELLDVVSDAALTAPRIVLESRIGRVEADAVAELMSFEAMLQDAAARFAERGA